MSHSHFLSTEVLVFRGLMLAAAVAAAIATRHPGFWTLVSVVLAVSLAYSVRFRRGTNKHRN